MGGCAVDWCALVLAVLFRSQSAELWKTLQTVVEDRFMDKPGDTLNAKKHRVAGLVMALASYMSESPMAMIDLMPHQGQPEIAPGRSEDNADEAHLNLLWAFLSSPRDGAA